MRSFQQINMHALLPLINLHTYTHPAKVGEDVLWIQDNTEYIHDKNYAYTDEEDNWLMKKGKLLKWKMVLSQRKEKCIVLPFLPVTGDACWEQRRRGAQKVPTRYWHDNILSTFEFFLLAPIERWCLKWQTMKGVVCMVVKGDGQNRHTGSLWHTQSGRAIFWATLPLNMFNIMSGND